jgi:hypothetical protein
MSTFGFMHMQGTGLRSFARLFGLLLLSGFWVGWAPAASGQAVLSLESLARFKRYRIYTGESFAVQLAGDKFWRTVTLERVHADSVRLFQEVSAEVIDLPISFITAVQFTPDNDGFRFKKLVTTALVLGGGTTLGLRAANAGSASVAFFEGGGFWIPAAALGVGLALRLTLKTKFDVRQGRRWQLRPLDTGLAPPPRRR